MDNGKYQILIVDDHPIVRHGIVQLVNRQSDLECKVEADDAESALQILSEKDFDLIVADISLPGLSGLDLVRRVHGTHPNLPMLVVSVLLLLFLCGLSGAILSELAGTDLMTAVLATVPGSIDSIALIAVSTHADMSFVMTLQTTRLFAVVLFGPQVARLLLRMASSWSKKIGATP